jgi:hypothetical protein
MNDRALAASLGANGNKWVRENLDVKRMTDSYIDLYSKLVNKKTGMQLKPPLLVNN